MIAHEIGHLLLGWNHWPTGLMRAEWKKKELAKIAEERLVFTPRQAKLVRVSAHERIRAA